MSIVYCPNADKKVDLDRHSDDVVTDLQGTQWYLPAMVNENKIRIRKLFSINEYEAICAYTGWDFEADRKKQRMYKNEVLYDRRDN